MTCGDTFISLFCSAVFQYKLACITVFLLSVFSWSTILVTSSCASSLNFNFQSKAAPLRRRKSKPRVTLKLEGCVISARESLLTLCSRFGLLVVSLFSYNSHGRGVAWVSQGWLIFCFAIVNETGILHCRTCYCRTGFCRTGYCRTGYSRTGYCRLVTAE